MYILLAFELHDHNKVCAHKHTDKELDQARETERKPMQCWFSTESDTCHLHQEDSPSKGAILVFLNILQVVQMHSAWFMK